MCFQPDPAIIRWRIHLASPPVQVYQLLATDEERRGFWAEAAIERDGAIDFIFPDGQTWRGKILDRSSPARFVVEYYGGSIATFDLSNDGAGWPSGRFNRWLANHMKTATRSMTSTPSLIDARQQ